MSVLAIFGGVVFACVCIATIAEWLAGRDPRPVDPYAKYPVVEHGTGAPSSFTEHQE